MSKTTEKHQQNIAEIKKVLVDSFQATAAKHNQLFIHVQYCFKLKDQNNFICKYKDEEIKISLPGIKGVFAGGVINKFITDALIRFSRSYKIQLGWVNVIMNIDTAKELLLTLMNGNAVVKEISIEELIKT